MLLSISSTTLEAVVDQRNEDGGKYYACELCGRDATSNGVVYITESGNAYHSNLGCSGLTRSIYAVPLSEVIGKGVCSRCGAN